jgi:cytidylate kinase
MDKKFAITIARQYCSGGHEIGEAVAKKLGVDFYDKELIELAAKKSGYSESVFEKADEVATNSLLYSVVMGSYPMNSLFFQNNNMLTNDTLFAIQSKIIKELVSEKSAVIVGRCSNYVLRDTPNLVRVYLRADMDFRIKRFMKLYADENTKEKDVEGLLQKADKKRATYHSYYSGTDWDNVGGYDIVINTAKVGIDGAVNQIISYLEATMK